MGENDWIWDILACPQCGSAIRPGDEGELACVNAGCGYKSQWEGRRLDLLPGELDRHQRAEHEFRVRLSERFADAVSWMDADTYRRFRLFNIITYYSFTSQYFFFRDFFIRHYQLQGRGLEIGGATGFHSGFIKFFYPGTQMVTSDVAPYNILMGEDLARWLEFDTDYFVMADAERLPFMPETFDFIFSSGMLHHLGDLRRALQKGRDALKPGGRWYIINELSIGALPRMFWDSPWGPKGKWALQTGVREKSYTLSEWQGFFAKGGFEIVETHFHRDPRHKLESWPRALYYALIARLPLALVKTGIPCEVNFVLEKL